MSWTCRHCSVAIENDEDGDWYEVDPPDPSMSGYVCSGIPERPDGWHEPATLRTTR